MKDWRKALIHPTSTIIEAIQVIDKAALQIAIVVDEEQRLLGTVTDGDVRRALLKGVPLGEQVQKIMNRNPKYVYEDEPYEKVVALFKKKKVHHIPILDRNKRIIRLERFDQVLDLSQKDNPVVLMAGGKGMRLRPLTKNCPKPLLKVGSKPILETIVENLIGQGFYQFYISVNYKADMIEDYFGNGSRWGVEISYLREDKPMGTAGALGLLPFRPHKPMIVMNGDILTKVNFQQLLAFHEQHQAVATMAIRDHTFHIPYGVINVDQHRIVRIEEKPIQRLFVNAGIYVLNPEVLNFIPKDTCLDMPVLFEELIKQGYETAGFPLREYWIDIGQMGEYRRANQEFEEVFQ